MALAHHVGHIRHPLQAGPHFLHLQHEPSGQQVRTSFILTWLSDNLEQWHGGVTRNFAGTLFAIRYRKHLVWQHRVLRPTLNRNLSNFVQHYHEKDQSSSLMPQCCLKRTVNQDKSSIQQCCFSRPVGQQPASEDSCFAGGWRWVSADGGEGPPHQNQPQHDGADCNRGPLHPPQDPAVRARSLDQQNHRSFFHKSLMGSCQVSNLLPHYHGHATYASFHL